VPLVALLGLVHLGVPLPHAVLGGAECRNQGGVNYRAGLERQSLGGQCGVDGGQQLDAQTQSATGKWRSLRALYSSIAFSCSAVMLGSSLTKLTGLSNAIGKQ